METRPASFTRALLLTLPLLAACSGSIADTATDVDGAPPEENGKADGGRSDAREPLRDGGQPQPDDVTLPPRDGAIATDGGKPPFDASHDVSIDVKQDAKPDAKPVDAGNDSGRKDGGADSGLSCGNDVCQGGELCCIDTSGGNAWCASSCGDAGASLECDSPDSCASGVCCGEIPLGPGQIPNCDIGTAKTRCQSKCDSTVPLQCNSTIRLQACNGATDCASATNGFQECCTISYEGVSMRACTNFTLKIGLGNYISDCE